MILLFQRHIAYYREDIYEELNRKFGIVACIGKKGPPKNYLKNAVPNCPFILINDFYPVSNKEAVAIMDFFTPILKRRPRIVITEFSLGILSNYILLLLRPIFRFKIILWGHGYNLKKGFNPVISFKDKLRIWWFRRADAIIVYGEKEKIHLSRYINHQKIFLAPNTLNTLRLLNLKAKFEQIGKEDIKRELGTTAKYNIVFIGRLLKEKEPDRLLDVFEIVASKVNSITLHFIGEGPMMESLKAKTDIILKRLDSKRDISVKFWGIITDEEQSGKILFASDLMVMPLNAGLSVVHAFCFGLPVLTQKYNNNKGQHQGPEAAYIANGYNGFWVKYDNNFIMANKIIEYLGYEEDKKKKIKQNASATIKDICSLNNFLDGFKRAIDYVNT